MRHSNFIKILYRFLKENDMFYHFMRYIKLSTVYDSIVTFYILEDFMSILASSIVSDNNDAKKLKKFLNSNSKKFELILINYYKNDIVKFLHDEHYFDDFSNSLYNLSSIKTLEDYIVKMGDNKVRLSMFILYAFHWTYSRNGFIYWDRCHRKYIEYMRNIL